MAVILFFGDSITFGAWDEEGGWVARMHTYINQKIVKSQFAYYHLVYSLGIAGDTTATMLERFEGEVKARLRREEAEYIFVFAIGINDSQLNRKTRKPQIALSTFKRNLKKILEKTKLYSSRVVFVGLTPVDEEVVNADPYYSNDMYTNESIKIFNDTVKEFCRKENNIYIDIFDEWIHKEYTSLLIDGLHPNTKGHKMLYSTIVEALEQNTII